MTANARLRDWLRDVAAQARLSFGGQSNLNEVRKILDALVVVKPMPLQRVGGLGDGGYWIPQKLSGFQLLFSPGVSEQISFDLELANQGIAVSMLDPSVNGPPQTHELFSFRKLRLAGYTSLQNGFIGFSDWFEQEMGGQSGQAMLQMDIEGDEYVVLPSIPEHVIRRFDIIIVEFHFLHHLMSANGFQLMSPALRRLLETMVVVASVVNSTCGSFLCDGHRYPRMLEVTFVSHRYLP